MRCLKRNTIKYNSGLLNLYETTNLQCGQQVHALPSLVNK